MKKEDVKGKLEQGLKELHQALAAGQSDRLDEYLRVMSRFHRYSFGNLILILCQNPEATQVAGYTKWKEFGRQVKKGESGIGILAPMTYKTTNDDGEETQALRGFKVVHVFDVSQTEGDELPEIAQTTGDAGDNIQRMEQLYSQEGIELEYAPLPPGYSGVSKEGKVTLRPGLASAERFRVLTHEFAHEKIHDSKRRQEAAKEVKETEAEAVAFVVCDYLGIDSLERSSDYIALHRGSEETLSESLELIQKTAQWIIEKLEAIELDPSPCDHAYIALLDNGHYAGTWTEIETDDGLRVECRHCGKFYGYRNEDAPLLETSDNLHPVDDSLEDDKEEELVVGRADYEERRNARIDRYRHRADARQREANATHDEARRMASAIPFGQPMMPGHHSYGRDKRYRERIHNKFGKSFELQDKAKYWDSRANAAEDSHAISSDDPQALVKLREKLASLEARQEQMKSVNAAWRKAKKPEADDAQGWSTVAKHLDVELDELDSIRKHFARHTQWSGRQPFEAYELSNNNANIRRVSERMENLARSANAEHIEEDFGVCTYVENAEENRVQLVFDGKPPKATRELLKQHGFRWSRRNTAWQRLLNNAAKRAAKSVIQKLSPSKEVTT